MTEPPDAARLAVRVEEARFELELEREVRRRIESRARRLEQDVRRLEAALSTRGAELEAVRERLLARERYVDAIHGSTAWRLIQKVRGLVGRRWAE